MFSRFVQTSARQREIAEIVLGHGWDYMRQLLTGGKAEEPRVPTPAVLRNILIDLGPVYVKLGQLLSTRPDLLPPEYIEALSDLQAQVPPVGWDAVEVILQQELRQPLDQVFQTIQQQPVAAGSIAQTHRATLLDGQEVALKVQRPDLASVVEQDIGLIKLAAGLVAQTEFGRYYDIVSLAEEFTQALQAELRFTREGRYTDQLRSNLAQSPWIKPDQLTIPQINWQLTSDRLLVMEWLNGSPILQAHFPPGETEGPKQLATLLLRAFFQQICLDGFFHADPHPGNVFYLQDQRLALLDCGMVGRLDPRTQEIVLELLLAIASMDAQRCAQLTLQLSPSDQPINRIRLENDFDRLLRQYYSLSLAELNFSQLFYQVLQAARKNQIKVPGNLGLCAKAIANLEGVARSLDPEFNLAGQLRPLMTDVLRQQLTGNAPVPTVFRTLLDLKNLSLQSPRQLEMLLERVTSESLQWNVSLKELESLRRTTDAAANRLSFSIVVGSLIMGAAVVASQVPMGYGGRVYWLSEALFGVASLVGLWLIFSIWRSGRLR